MACVNEIDIKNKSNYTILSSNMPILDSILKRLGNENIELQFCPRCLLRWPRFTDAQPVADMAFTARSARRHPKKVAKMQSWSKSKRSLCNVWFLTTFYRLWLLPSHVCLQVNRRLLCLPTIKREVYMKSSYSIWRIWEIVFFFVFVRELRPCWHPHNLSLFADVWWQRDVPLLPFEDCQSPQPCYY